MTKERLWRLSLSALAAFSALSDPRIARTRRYPLGDLLLLTLCGLICGADNYVAICKWGHKHPDWLREQFGIVAIPSHDTLGRVFAKLDSHELAATLAAWNATLWNKLKKDEEIIAFDGKRIQGAANNLNLISAWASRSQLTLALADAGEGGEEQEALRRLLAVVDVQNCWVTADAMHTQAETAKAIVEKNADYLLALKANQGGAFDSSKACFDLIRDGTETAADSCVHRQKRGSHTYEERRCWTLTDVGLVDPWSKWAGLKTVVCISRRVFQENVLKSEQTRYFLSSATGSAGRFLRATRLHWGIENSQHWRLDVFFREDDSRVRVGNAAMNLSTLRRLALGLLKRERSEKVGVQTKRMMCGWDSQYLQKVLAI